MTKVNKLRVALVHDYMTQFGGAERVLHVLHNIFPQAPIYTLFSDHELTDVYFPTADIRTSFLQKFPKKLHSRFRYLAPLAIPAIENFDLQKYDIVISSSAFFAKGIITNPDTIHISYCHTPTKHLWELKEEKRRKKEGVIRHILEKMTLHFFRLWDFNAAARVDYFIANSKNTKQRIKKYYNKDSFIVYPCAGAGLLENGQRSDRMHKKSVLAELPKKYFLIVSQLQDYKNIDIAVEAFSRMKYPLVIIGDGPEKKNLEKMASDNVIFLGRQPDDIVQYAYENCFAYIYPGREDFGISAVEAMIFGKPVLAYRAGGVLESVVEGVSGEFFDDLHPAVLADGIRRLINNYDAYNPAMMRNIGNRYNTERFQLEFKRVLKRILAHEWEVA